jgi:hypothetical protein
VEGRCQYTNLHILVHTKLCAGTCHRLLISVSVAPIDTPSRRQGENGGGLLSFFPAVAVLAGNTSFAIDPVMSNLTSDTLVLGGLGKLPFQQERN